MAELSASDVAAVVNTESLLTAALGYATDGFFIIPLRPRTGLT